MIWKSQQVVMQVLQKQLQDQLVKNVGGLKVRKLSNINTSKCGKLKHQNMKVG